MVSAKVFKKVLFLMQDIRQSAAWKAFAEVRGWKVVEVPSQDGKHTLQATILPLGMLGLNFLKIQRSLYVPNWQELKKIRRNNWVFSSIIEPVKIKNLASYLGAGYKLSRFPYLATKSVIIDINKSERALWKELSENSRRLIVKNKHAEIKEVSAEVFLNNWKRFSKIWTMKLDEMTKLKEKLGEKMSFLLCFENNECQSGILVVESGDMVNYYQSFTTDAGRRTGAHYFLVWKTILSSKKKGLKFFDFEGIYDKRWPQKRWLGFTEFKKKFGGKVVTYPGCYSRLF